MDPVNYFSLIPDEMILPIIEQLSDQDLKTMRVVDQNLSGISEGVFKMRNSSPFYKNKFTLIDYLQSNRDNLQILRKDFALDSTNAQFILENTLKDYWELSPDHLFFFVKDKKHQSHSLIHHYFEEGKAKIEKFEKVSFFIKMQDFAYYADPNGIFKIAKREDGASIITLLTQKLYDKSPFINLKFSEDQDFVALQYFNHAIEIYQLKDFTKISLLESEDLKKQAILNPRLFDQEKTLESDNFQDKIQSGQIPQKLLDLVETSSRYTLYPRMEKSIHLYLRENATGEEVKFGPFKSVFKAYLYSKGAVVFNYLNACQIFNNKGQQILHPSTPIQEDKQKNKVIPGELVALYHDVLFLKNGQKYTGYELSTGSIIFEKTYLENNPSILVQNGKFLAFYSQKEKLVLEEIYLRPHLPKENAQETDQKKSVAIPLNTVKKTNAFKRFLKKMVK